MAKERTKKSKHQSRYSDAFVTEAQYITEFICEKAAQRKNKDLPQRFWQLPEWKKFFGQQILAANGLLKIYCGAAIIRALKSQEAFGIYSLRAPQLDAILKKYQKIVDAEQEALKAAKPIERLDTHSQPREKVVKNNPISKLMELDNE